MTLRLGATISSQDAAILENELEDVVYSEINAVQALLPQAAKYAGSAYGDLAGEFGDFLNRATTLQNRLNRGLDAGEVSGWQAQVQELGKELADFRMRVVASLRGGVSSRETGAVLWTAATLVGVGIVGWFVLKK